MIDLKENPPEIIKDNLDTRGMNCPLPILKTKKMLNELSIGDVLRVITSDPLALLDFKAFCAHAAHDLVYLIENEDDECEFFIVKGSR